MDLIDMFDTLDYEGITLFCTDNIQTHDDAFEMFNEYINKLNDLTPLDGSLKILDIICTTVIDKFGVLNHREYSPLYCEFKRIEQFRFILDKIIDNGEMLNVENMEYSSFIFNVINYSDEFQTYEFIERMINNGESLDVYERNSSLLMSICLNERFSETVPIYLDLVLNNTENINYVDQEDGDNCASLCYFNFNLFQYLISKGVDMNSVIINEFQPGMYKAFLLLYRMSTFDNFFINNIDNFLGLNFRGVTYQIRVGDKYPFMKFTDEELTGEYEKCLEIFKLF